MGHADTPVPDEQLPVGLVCPDADVRQSSLTLTQNGLVCGMAKAGQPTTNINTQLLSLAGSSDTASAGAAAVCYTLGSTLGSI